jgi:hypothetical protein
MAADDSVRPVGPPVDLNRLSMAEVNVSGWAEPINPLQARVSPALINPAASSAEQSLTVRGSVIPTTRR